MDNTEVKKAKKNADFWIIAATLILLSFGIVMVSSASSYASIAQYGKQNIFLNQQSKAAAIGLIVMLVASAVDYKWMKKLSYPAFAISFIAMLLVFIPGLSGSSGGATRWLRIAGQSMQPSEFMKIGLIFGLSMYISTNFKKIDNKIKGLIPCLCMLSAVGIALYFQNHMSGVVIMCVIAFSIILASGIRIKKRYVAGSLILILIAGAIFIFGDPTGFRLKRIVNFVKPTGEIQSSGEWQANQSLYAVGSGKLFGRGLGQSRQKYLWLPEAQTDFIFAVLAEELGWIGCAVVLLCFFILILRGYVVALSSRDLFCTLVATGITSMIAAQVIINICVVTAMVPVTGMPLPLFSYGGTALIINLGAIGVLLNMSKRVE
ncbi:MAG: putative lipid II flippase FtsW [Clostridia bacterium]